MWVRHRSQASGTKEDDDDDTDSCSTNTSRWSIPSRLSSDQHSSTRSPGSQQSGFKKVRGGYMQKINHHKLKLPPIKSIHVSQTRVQSANMNLIREMRNQVWDLQQQLGEARNENKLLKQVQYRHTMALQHFQQTEGSIGQIIYKHNNEARAHQKLLAETRICRDNLYRQLQATETELFDTKAALHHLEQLSKDQNLLEREELILRLAKATAELEDKNKRIQDMERNLKLCQASFKRQIMTEQAKVNEARNLSYHLHGRIYGLTTEIQYKEKEMAKHNIYTHRFLKGSSKKGRENKMVQTDGLMNITTNSPSLLEMEYSEGRDTADKQISKTLPCSNQEQEASITQNPEKKISDGEVIFQGDAEMCSGSSILIKEHTSENNDTEESQERSSKHQIQNDFITEMEESEALPDKKQEKTHETSVLCISETFLDTTEAKKNKHKIPKTRHNYTFKRSTENLHNGFPAYGDTSSPDIPKGVLKVEFLSLEIKDISLQDGKFRSDGDD